MERFNLFDQPGTDETRRTLDQRLNTFFATYADPKYDVWKGGTSKARRLAP